MSWTVWTKIPGTDTDVIVATDLPTEGLAESIVRNLAEVYEDLSANVEQD